MIKKLKENFINISLSVLMLLIVVNAALIIYNKYVMDKNNTLQKQTDAVKLAWNAIFESNLRRMDLGLRGYALIRNEGILGPYHDGLRDMPRALKNIDSLLAVQKLDTLQQQFEAFKPRLISFMQHTAHMLDLVKQNDTTQFINLLNEDRGRDLWLAFAPMFTKVMRYEDELVEQSRIQYARAMNRNVILQVVLVLITVPTLTGVIYRIRRDGKNRAKLLLEFDENNRRYLFNPGMVATDHTPQTIIQSSIHNLKKASTFIKSIANGDYSVHWEGLTPENAPLNEENLTGDLIKMRDQMKKVKELDAKRIWSTEGLAKFSDVARTNQNDIEKLSNEVIRFLTKHLQAQQGSLFVLEGDDDGDMHLELKACYAFDKKKYIEKHVDIGSGLVGQAFLEGNTILLTDVPRDYIKITSGLGDATPNCVIIVPMKYNGRVEAVLELASFTKFAAHEVEFIEKAGEVIASSIYSTRTNERTAKLLKETQQQAEALRSQEEELRQNMEEMQATQEDMKRREGELRKQK